MPTLDLALEEDAPKDLQVTWSWAFTRARVTYKGASVLKFHNGDALRDGAEATLPDGSRLAVKIVSPWFVPSLEVLRDGVPLPGSPTHPRSRIATSAYWLLGAALLPLFDILFAFTRPTRSSEPFGYVFANGVVFAVLAFSTRREARWALVLGFGLYVVDSIVMLVRLRMGMASINVGGNFLLFRIATILMLLRGLRAHRDLERLNLKAMVDVFR